MNTTKILNILTRSLRSGVEFVQRKSLASQCECHSEPGFTCENHISAYNPRTRDGKLVFNVLAGGAYPFINTFK